jgi:hypothetical protein
MNASDDALREVYRAEQLPVLQNRMFASAEAARACARGDVVLVQSDESGLIFNRAFRPELVEYDADYQNEQGLSGAFARHLDAVLDVMRRHFAGTSLLEVGCGKGLFLERLLGAGFDVTGLDPTYEGSNPRVIREFFTPEVGIRAEGIVLRHVLEHVQDPVAFLPACARPTAARHDLHRGAVPRLDRVAPRLVRHLLRARQLLPARRLRAHVRHGPRGPGILCRPYLYVVADLATLRAPRRPRDDVFSLPRGSCRRSRRAERACGPATAARARSGAGASKGVIFALLMERAGVRIDTVIDINPAKQGRYLAATGLRVQSPDEAMAHLPAGADVFVMNSNYRDEIEALTAHRYRCVTIERGNSP